MKILHTSDWHLGQLLQGQDRRDEHEYMLEQLVGLVCQEQPDAFILAGDIYDIAQPSVQTQRFFSRCMVALHEACPTMTIVSVSGNHDSGARYEIYQEPWEALHVHTIGTLHPDDPLAHIVEVRHSASAPVLGYIVAVPYANTHFVPEGFYERLVEAVSERNTQRLPQVLVHHLSVGRDQCDYSGHELSYDKYIGGIECTDIDMLGRDYDYIALGHIHKAQNISRHPLTRYSGSPLAVSFDESRPGYTHGVSMVELPAHGEPPTLREVELEQVVPLENIPSAGSGSWSDVLGALAVYPSDKRTFIRLNVVLKDAEILPPDREEQIASALAGKAAKVLCINPVRELSEEGQRANGVVRVDAETLRCMQPVELARIWVEKQKAVFTPDFAEMFEEAHKRALQLNGDAE